MTEAPLKTFRVHFHDETSVDIDAAAPLIAEARARKQHPGSFVKKVKLVRDAGSNTKSIGCYRSGEEPENIDGRGANERTHPRPKWREENCTQDACGLIAHIGTDEQSGDAASRNPNIEELSHAVDVGSVARGHKSAIATSGGDHG